MTSKNAPPFGPMCRQVVWNKPSLYMLLVFFLHICIAPGQLFAATAGLPFTEKFSNTNHQDTNRTTADWFVEEGLFQIGQSKRTFGNLTSETTSRADIGGVTYNAQALVLSDMDGDGKVGMEDLIFILQKVALLR